MIRRFTKRTLVVFFLMIGMNYFLTGASAHTALQSSTPQAGSVIAEFPELIELRFNEPLLTLGQERSNYFELSSLSGVSYRLGPMVVDGARISASVEESDFRAGEHLISYRIVASDGHVLRGEVRFVYSPEEEIATGSTPSVTSDSQDETRSDDTRLSVLVLSILIALTFTMAVLILLRSGEATKAGSEQR